MIQDHVTGKCSKLHTTSEVAMRDKCFKTMREFHLHKGDTPGMRQRFARVVINP
jgi:hypothetical protein